ncbi:MAG TPA: hypothetical protein VFJ22_06015 [Dermatophilaceae bacterium]|nr:hypothetical protein [Dermatophilaceae bacterium]
MDRQMRWYLALMGSCIGLLALAWFLVRLWSVPLAIGMSVVAASSRRWPSSSRTPDD